MAKGSWLEPVLSAFTSLVGIQASKDISRINFVDGMMYDGVKKQQTDKIVNGFVIAIVLIILFGLPIYAITKE